MQNDFSKKLKLIQEQHQRKIERLSQKSELKQQRVKSKSNERVQTYKQQVVSLLRQSISQQTAKPEVNRQRQLEDELSRSADIINQQYGQYKSPPMFAQSFNQREEYFTRKQNFTYLTHKNSSKERSPREQF